MSSNTSGPLDRLRINQRLKGVSNAFAVSRSVDVAKLEQNQQELQDQLKKGLNYGVNEYVLGNQAVSNGQLDMM